MTWPADGSAEKSGVRGLAAMTAPSPPLQGPGTPIIMPLTADAIITPSS